METLLWVNYLLFKNRDLALETAKCEISSAAALDSVLVL
jgi:hypothetical protein